MVPTGRFPQILEIGHVDLVRPNVGRRTLTLGLKLFVPLKSDDEVTWFSWPLHLCCGVSEDRTILDLYLQEEVTMMCWSNIFIPILLQYFICFIRFPSTTSTTTTTTTTNNNNNNSGVGGTMSYPYHPYLYPPLRWAIHPKIYHFYGWLVEIPRWLVVFFMLYSDYSLKKSVTLRFWAFLKASHDSVLLP